MTETSESPEGQENIPADIPAAELEPTAVVFVLNDESTGVPADPPIYLASYTGDSEEWSNDLAQAHRFSLDGEPDWASPDVGHERPNVGGVLLYDEPA